MATVLPPTRQRPGTGTFLQGEDKPIGKPRWATAAGAGDQYCHWYLNRSRTLCGITHEPLERHEMHREAPCPNGNPPCPACVTAYANGGL